MRKLKRWVDESKENKRALRVILKNGYQIADLFPQEIDEQGIIGIDKKDGMETMVFFSAISTIKRNQFSSTPASENLTK